MKRLFALIMGIIIAVTLIGCQSTNTKSASTATTEEKKEPYKIGAVVSVTGPAAPLGEPEKKTLEMLVEKINKEGGIDGHKVELFIEDDQSDPKNANIAVSKLIDQQGVVAVLGGTTTPSTLAMKPKTAQAKIPHVSMAAGIKITDPTDASAPNTYIFRTAQSDAVAVQKVIDYLSKSLKVKNFAIIHDSNAFGQSGADELQKLAPGAGLTVVAVEAYKTDDTNMTSQLTKINSAKPEALVVWGTNPGPAIIAKNMKQLNMTIPYVGSHGIANKKFIELAGDAAEGVVFPAGKILVPTSATGEQAQVINQFMQDYEAKYGEKPNSFAGHAYDAFMITVNALKIAGSDTEKLREAIEATTGFNGISGVFNYSKDNHDGTTTSDMIMVLIKGGKWEELK